MSDDLVKRLRNNCSCNFPDTPCGAEEECRNAFEAASRIEKLEAALRWYEWSMCELGDGHGACGKLRDDECAGCRARKALEGKDE